MASGKLRLKLQNGSRIILPDHPLFFAFAILALFGVSAEVSKFFGPCKFLFLRRDSLITKAGTLSYDYSLKTGRFYEEILVASNYSSLL
jgi:hypothetical protein